MIRALALYTILIGFAAPLAAASAPIAADVLLELANEIQQAEIATPGLKKDNQARLEFANRKQPAKTPLTFLYLHGFSASPRESSPLIENLAAIYKANAYFPRLKGHGIEGPDGLKGVTLEDWEKETDLSLARASQLGEKVVVISMSTGSSLAVPALLRHPENVAAHIMISPNFRLYRWDSQLLLLPFGKWIARLFLGEYHQWQAQNSTHDYYWTTRYPSSAAVEAARAAYRAKNADLLSLKIPTCLIYSPDDTVVHIPSMLNAYGRLGAEPKEKHSLPNREGTHNIAGDILAPQTTKLIQEKIIAFLQKLQAQQKQKI